MKTISMSYEEYKNDLNDQFLKGYRKSILDLSKMLKDVTMGDLKDQAMIDLGDCGLTETQILVLLDNISKVKSNNV
jgi:hypothetical protein